MDYSYAAIFAVRVKTYKDVSGVSILTNRRAIRMQRQMPHECSALLWNSGYCVVFLHCYHRTCRKPLRQRRMSGAVVNSAIYLPPESNAFVTERRRLCQFDLP
jgi:hypothetical protein